MIVKGVTLAQLEKTLTSTNWYYANNIEFKPGTPEPLNAKKDRWRVGLQPKDTKSRLGVLHGSYDGRRLKAVCWHAHGRFFAHLPEGAIITTRHHRTFPKNDWKDWNCSSNMLPVWMSDRCTCEQAKSGNLGFVPIAERLKSFDWYKAGMFDSLQPQERMVKAEEFVTIGRIKAEFGPRARDIAEHLKTLGNVPRDLRELKVSVTETWNSDVLNRYRVSQLSYNATGG